MKIGRNELAEFMNINGRTVESWVNRDGCPYLRKPGVEGATEWVFESLDVVNWYGTRLEAGASMDVVKAAKGRQIIAEAGIKELDLSERTAQMFYIEDARPYWQEMFTVFKTRFNAIPSRLAQIVAVESDPAVCLRLLKSEMNAALEGLQVDGLIAKIRAGRKGA